VIGYLEWVERVLQQIVSERPSGQYFDTWQLAEALGLEVNGVPDEQRNPILIAIDRARADTLRVKVRITSRYSADA
jgi:hypothetical protein